MRGSWILPRGRGGEQTVDHSRIAPYRLGSPPAFRPLDADLVWKASWRYPYPVRTDQGLYTHNLYDCDQYTYQCADQYLSPLRAGTKEKTFCPGQKKRMVHIRSLASL